MNKPLRVMLLLAVLALALAGMAVLGHRSGSRGALQKYKAELRAKGEKLTFEELVRSNSTNANPAIAVLTNAVGRLQYSGLGPGFLEPRMFVGPGRARILWKEESPFGVASKNTGGVTNWEDFAAQMEDYRQPLQELRDALKDPPADWGLRTNFMAGPVPNFVAVRAAAQWLMAASLNELHQGRPEEALENLEALASLARLNRDECTLVSQMIRVAVANMGIVTTWEALQAPGWTDAQLERLQRAWESVNLADALEKGFIGERVGGEELWRIAHSSDSRKLRELLNLGSSTRFTLDRMIDDYVWLPVYKVTSIDEDELFRLKTMQTWIEGFRALQAGQPWKEARASLDKAWAEVTQVANAPGSFRYRLSLVSIPNFTKATQTGVRAETERRMMIVAIALKRYELRHGKLPSSLDALVPEFITELPWDFMSGKLFCYRLSADGTFVLYSMGEDGQDDGGDATPKAGETFGLWNGRDAVWPWPGN